MTLIVLGYSKPYNRLQCSADSRLGNKDGVLTDSAPKILPLRLQYWAETTNIPSHEKTDFVELGFAYSGSSLTALSTYGWLVAALSQLTDDRQIPTEDKIANPLPAASIASVGLLASETAQRIVGDACFRNSGTLARNESDFIFHAYIFGYCLQERRLLAVEIVHEFVDDKFTYQCKSVDFLKMGGGKSCCVAMGTGSSVFGEFFRESLASNPSTTQNSIMQRVLDESPEPTVGGSFQSAFATKEQFLITPRLEVTEDGPLITLIGADITKKRIGNHALNWASEHM